MITDFDIFGNKLLVHVPQMFLTHKDILFKKLNSEIIFHYLACGVLNRVYNYYIPGLRHHTLKIIPCSMLHTHLGQIFLRRHGIVCIVLSVFHCRQMSALTFWKMLKAITVYP